MTGGNLQEIDNPLDGILPAFTPFGVEVDSLTRRVIAVVLVLSFLAIVVQVVRGLVDVAAARGHDPRRVREARMKVRTAGLSMVTWLLAAVLLIVVARD